MSPRSTLHPNSSTTNPCNWCLFTSFCNTSLLQRTDLQTCSLLVDKCQENGQCSDCECESESVQGLAKLIRPRLMCMHVADSGKEFGNAIDVWSAEKGYIITYPISAGRDWNTVLSHFRDGPVTDVEENVDMNEVREYFKNIDPRLKKIIDVLPPMKRWPLLITGPLESWSSPQKNVVLMGDAAHTMQNHMAQGEYKRQSFHQSSFLDGLSLTHMLTSICLTSRRSNKHGRRRLPRPRPR